MKRIVLICLAVLIAAGIYLYTRPLPLLAATNQIPTAPKTATIKLPWPDSGQAALGAQGYGLLASKNSADQPVPIASISKVITALAILEQKPLAPEQNGPNITFDNTDLDYFNYYYTHNGSVAQVKPGEVLSEYQALQAMLIPSANNMADSLARWAFGSMPNYITYANNMVKQMGLQHTTVGGASGFADDTTSTASDLVKLGLAALDNPVIADVVGQKSATIPVAGTINNVNWLLGQNKVIGIKTGNTEQAGGCYLFAAKHQIDGQSITIVGAILGAPQLIDAIGDATPLLNAIDSGFAKVTVIHKNQPLGSYQTPWGSSSVVMAAKDLSLLIWKNQPTKIQNNLKPIKAPAKTGTPIGSVSVQNVGKNAAVPVVLAQNLAAPPLRWHIFR